VDDEEPIREALRYAVEDAGFVAVEASNGYEALEHLRRSWKAMVVLLDLMMPKMDGMQLLQIVGDESATLGRHRFILMAANPPTRPMPFTQLLTQLQVPVLSEPFDTDQMLNAVEIAASRLDDA